MDEASLKVNFLDGSVSDISIQASDIIDFEERFAIPIDRIELFTHMAYLAFAAIVRNKATALTWDEWKLTLKSVSFNDPKDLSV